MTVEVCGRHERIKSSPVRNPRRNSTMTRTSMFFLLLIQTLHCLVIDDSPFELTNKATGFCLVKTNNLCNDLRWTTGDRLLVPQKNKCLGVQGKSVGSEIHLYECDENSDLQKWECKNETLLALKDQELYIELTADNTAVLTRTVGPRNFLTISGMSSGACTRTFRELYTIGGNAAGTPCMFPFQYKDQWYSECTRIDSQAGLWCAVETKYQNELWGLCPVTTKGGWNAHPTTGAYYQLNTQSALTWSQAAKSCKQQGASLLSITDPHEQAYVTALLQTGGNKLWTGLILHPEQGWKWSNGRPYRYMRWDSGHPLQTPGYTCAMMDAAVNYLWQSFPCSKKLGYICYSKANEALPTQAAVTGVCSRPWIPYNGHCFYLNRTQRTWPDAQRDCRNRGGDLAGIYNVEDQSFMVSQLGIVSTDELWIGLNDRKIEGLFEWADHSTVTFTSWEFGKPAVSSVIKDCVVIRGESGSWADRTCEEKHGFICTKMSSTKATEDEATKDEGCKTGWKRHGSYCYYIGPETKNFHEAAADCHSHDSYLADVSNKLDNAFLISLVGMRPEKHFWLGLSNQKDIDQFVWTNTDVVTFTHWSANMAGSGQGCVAMTTGIFAGLWDLLPCTNREKYICKHLAEGATATPVAPTFIAPSECLPDWSRLKGRNYCVKVFQGRPQHRTWYQARHFCTVIGGDLLSIHSMDDLKSIYWHGQFWIGLSAPDPSTGYVWSDGSPVQFQHWDEKEPNNKNNVESCVEINMYNSKWSDVHCEKDLGWLCQIPIGVTPNSTPDPPPPDYNRTFDGWLEWNGNQYYISFASMAMEEARHFCKGKQSDLVTINSEAESVFLWKQLQRGPRSFWIGLTVDLDKTYGWVDGSPVVFLRWDEGQPRFQNNDENCAVMTQISGFWLDSSCGLEHSFICKRNNTKTGHATVSPTVPPRGGCPTNWKKLKSKCYRIITTQRETWAGARTQCKAMGGNLASITSRHDQVFLITAVAEAPTTALWIGLHSQNGNQFYWTDGKPKRFNNWNYRSPRYHRYKKRECAVMNISSSDEFGKWTPTSCNDTYGYICLQSVDPSLPESPEPTTSNYVQFFNDSLKVVSRKMTWDAAQKHCKDDGASLASIRNIWSDTYIDLISLNLNAPVWIGLNTIKTGGYFRFTEGWHLTITDWDGMEPQRDRPCVYVDVNGKWKTSLCERSMASVCIKSTEVPPTEPAEFPGTCPDPIDEPGYRGQLTPWLPFKGNCYLFWTNFGASWPEASAYCAAYGASLASIEDPSEQNFIQSRLKVYQDSARSFWIGLYKTHRGQWLWLDKAPLDYTNWDFSQPHNTGYGSLRASNGKWLTSGYRGGYICKSPKVLQETPPLVVNPTEIPQTNGGSSLPVVSVICVTVVVTVLLLCIFLLKMSGRRFHVPGMSHTFQNSMFFNRMQSQPDLADTNDAERKVEGENSELRMSL